MRPSGAWRLPPLLIVCIIVLSHTPRASFYQHAREINAHLDALFAAEQDPQVTLCPSGARSRALIIALFQAVISI